MDPLPLSPERLQRLIIIAGPTASGKSAVALALARRLGGEIISVDSMQVYRGLDLGTAKPSAAERAEIPHHLVDVAGLEEEFDAARFVRLASRSVEEIERRGRVIILSGGTGFYFKALLEGLAEGIPADAELRRRLEATPLPELLRELEQADPAAHASIDRANRRRVVRAVEVVRLTGRPFALARPARCAGPAPFAVGLEWPREKLVERINCRVDGMFRAGLVEETRVLLERGLERNRTAMQALGYRQVVEHVRGERDLAGTIEAVKTGTRQFARRQLTWFRRQMRLDWLPAAGEAAGLAAEIERRWREAGGGSFLR